MRKGNKKLNFIIILIICFSLSLSTVQAYAFDYTSLDIKNAGGRGEGLCILEFASGTLGEDEEVVYEIDVPFDGILRIDRVYDREQGFYGRYDVRIDELDFEHTFFNDTLEEGSRAVYDVAKGTYSLKVSTYKAYAGYCISVKVYPTSDVPATGMFLPAYDGTLAVGDSMQLLCAPEPEYSTDTIIWKSSNKKIATVDENGIVTATGLGTATITAQSKETGVKDTCKIKVRKMNYNMWTSEKKASLQKYVKHLKNYEKGKWSSSKTSVIKVSNTGKLTPIKSGTATVKFKCDGKTYSFKIYVYKKSSMKNKAIDALEVLTLSPDSVIVEDVGYDIANDRSAVLVTLDFAAPDAYGYYSSGTFYYVGENKKYDFTMR